MYIIRVDSRWLNLRYFIFGQRHDGTAATAHLAPGSLRVRLATGIEADVLGPDAARVARHLDALVVGDEPPGDVATAPGPGPGGETAATGVRTSGYRTRGEPAPRRRTQGKKD